MGTRTRFFATKLSTSDLEQVIATGSGKHKLKAQNELAKRQKTSK